MLASGPTFAVECTWAFGSMPVGSGIGLALQVPDDGGEGHDRVGHLDERFSGDCDGRRNDSGASLALDELIDVLLVLEKADVAGLGLGEDRAASITRSASPCTVPLTSSANCRTVVRTGASFLPRDPRTGSALD